MGNRMFQYACAYALAKEKNTSWCLSDLKHLDAFSLKPGQRVLNALKYAYFRLTRFASPSQYEILHCQDNTLDHSDMLLHDNHMNAWHYGYFQGRKYFYGHDADIRSLFKIKKKYRKIFEMLYAGLPHHSRLITVHIRRKDYKDFGSKELGGPDLTLPLSYYHSILAETDLSDALVMILSDDIDEMRSAFPYLENVHYSTHDAITDLQFMMKADTLIIANSTFGWWGAYLNGNPRKKVYAPRHFLGFKTGREYPVGILPAEWELRDVSVENTAKA
jgi:hypothetical protein